MRHWLIYLVFISLSCIYSNGISAQDRHIQVLDSKTKEAVINAQIKYGDGRHCAITDWDGNAELSNLSENDSIEVFSAGYLSAKIQVSSLMGKPTAEIWLRIDSSKWIGSVEVICYRMTHCFGQPGNADSLRELERLQSEVELHKLPLRDSLWWKLSK